MRAANDFPIHLIESQTEFDLLCKSWAELNTISFDTEFVRTNKNDARALTMIELIHYTTT